MADSGQERNTESLQRTSTCTISKNAEHAISALIIILLAQSGRTFVRFDRDSSSRNAVNFFIRMNNETLSCVGAASAIQIVRPLESIADTQPQLQPAFTCLLLTTCGAVWIASI